MAEKRTMPTLALKTNLGCCLRVMGTHPAAEYKER